MATLISHPKNMSLDLSLPGIKTFDGKPKPPEPALENAAAGSQTESKGWIQGRGAHASVRVARIAFFIFFHAL